MQRIDSMTPNSTFNVESDRLNCPPGESSYFGPEHALKLSLPIRSCGQPSSFTQRSVFTPTRSIMSQIRWPLLKRLTSAYWVGSYRSSSFCSSTKPTVGTSTCTGSARHARDEFRILQEWHARSSLQRWGTSWLSTLTRHRFQVRSQRVLREQYTTRSLLVHALNNYHNTTLCVSIHRLCGFECDRARQSLQQGGILRCVQCKAQAIDE